MKSRSFRYNTVKEEGWTMLENVRFRGPFTPKLVSFVKPNERGVFGDEMVWIAKRLGIETGQRDAEWLEENQQQIPIEARGKYLVFPRTVLLHPSVGRKIACLFFDGERWKFCFDMLNRRWSQGVYFVHR